MKRRVLKFVDMLFERDGIIQGLVTAMMVLASEYWALVYTPDELTAAVTFTILTPVTITVYVFWDMLEAGFEEYFFGQS